jgi:hypothetical protein
MYPGVPPPGAGNPCSPIIPLAPGMPGKPESPMSPFTPYLNEENINKEFQNKIFLTILYFLVNHYPRKILAHQAHHTIPIHREYRYRLYHRHHLGHLKRFVLILYFYYLINSIDLPAGTPAGLITSPGSPGKPFIPGKPSKPFRPLKIK